MNNASLEIIKLVGGIVVALLILIGIYFPKDPRFKIVAIAFFITITIVSMKYYTDTGKRFDDVLACVVFPDGAECKKDQHSQIKDVINTQSAMVSDRTALNIDQSSTRKQLAQIDELEWEDGGFFKERGVYRKTNVDRIILHSFLNNYTTMVSKSPNKQAIAVAESDKITVFGNHPPYKTILDFHQVLATISVNSLYWTSENTFIFQIEPSIDITAFNINNRYVVLLEDTWGGVHDSPIKIYVKYINAPLQVKLSKSGLIEEISPAI